MSAPVWDLLREPRRQLGQESLLAVLPLRRRLLLQGLLVAAAVVGGSLGVLAIVLLQRGWLQTQLAALEPYEQAAATLQGQLTGQRKALGQLTAANRALAEGLTTVRASSALLRELQRCTPEGVQLLLAEARGGDLVLRGEAIDPQAFLRVNALQLELRRSPLLQGAQLQLTRVERQTLKDAQAAGTAPAGATPAAATAGARPRRPLPVVFEISAPFASLTPARQLQVLRLLGAAGMAQRLELLQREGVL